MRKQDFWRGDKKFWSPIAIGSGLVIFLFGISTVHTGSTGWFTIGSGLVLLVLGFWTAPIRESSSRVEEQQHTTETDYDSHSDSDHSEAVYQTYRDERKSLQNALLDQSRSFDKYVLTLAAGTFGLSFLFIRHIAPEPSTNTMALLVTAWCFFAISILMTLLSFLASQQACLRQIEILDFWLHQRSEEKPESANVFTKVTRRLNWLSMVMFMSGVALLIIFAALNVFGARGG